MKPLVVVPTYNEAQGIAELLERALASHPGLDLLVVDDSSPDGTAEIVRAVAGRQERVRLMSRAGKQGLGKAYLAGFREGLRRGYDLFLEMDADLSHDPADLPRLIHAAANADVVIGSRYVPGGDVTGWSRGRHLLSWSANRYAQAMLGFPVRDSTAGFRCYHRHVLEGMELDTVASEGYAFQVEMTYRAWRAGHKIVEIPIVFRERATGESKMSKSIVLEGIVRVTRWGIGDLPHRVRSRG